MACGTPVITSEGSGTGEVAGDAALLVAPTDTDALSQTMGRLLDQPSLQEQCRRQGLERAAQFSWASSSAATRRLLENICRLS